jgi:hypothetical protein
MVEMRRGFMSGVSVVGIGVVEVAGGREGIRRVEGKEAWIGVEDDVGD